MEKEKLDFLTKHKKDIQRGIWASELDVRLLERHKITSAPTSNQLGEIETIIRENKKKIRMYKDMIELIDDIVKEDSNSILLRQ